MPLFKIQLRSQSHVAEAKLIERNDHTQLRVEVAQFVGQLLKNHAEQVWADEDWRVDVTDERGLILYVMHLSAHCSAATDPRHQ